MLIVGASGALAVGGTTAFFSDTEISAGNLFTAGAIDLLVDNESYYNSNVCAVDEADLDDDDNTEEYLWQGTTGFPVPGTPCDTSWDLDNLNNGDVIAHRFFNFDDVKPDDEGEDTISLHVQNEAWMCMDVTLTSNDDNSSNEPELLDGDAQEDEDNSWDGELAQNLQMFWWADDGDNVLEDDEVNNDLGISGGVQSLLNLAPQDGVFAVALADSENNVWGIPGPLPVGTSYIAKAWCFGSLSLDPVTAGDGVNPAVASGVLCDGTNIPNVNQVQTDGATLDVEFRAVQARHNESFLCEAPPETRACTEQEEYASAFHDVDQGTRKNGTAILADRTDPGDALGAPQHPLGLDYDSPVVAGSFFSLGFKGTPAAIPGGSIVVSFPGDVVQGPGPDLKLWEVTGGTSYPDEIVRVEVSNNLAGPWTLVDAAATRDAEMELPIPSAKYVRITDVSPPAPFEATADGFDLDAVQALNCEVPLSPNDGPDAN